MALASRSLPRGMSQQLRTGDLERDMSERNLVMSITKAITRTEGPVKQKHVRSAIIGTHRDHGSNTFWLVVDRLQVQGNPIICWKFCYVLHKLLREGHPNVITESVKFSNRLKELGKLWGHLREGYGRLNDCYCRLLVQKLEFHQKTVKGLAFVLGIHLSYVWSTQNQAIPGNLELSDNKLYEMTNNDPNAYFELTVDMMDYMDEILGLQAAVFGSMDMARANSMTTAGQCRLSPLIICVMDSCQLYDCIVSMLFKLHRVVPIDTLSGHRDRFQQEFTGLKSFYTNSQNLQYFRNLIIVPNLPASPPNFLENTGPTNERTHAKLVAELLDSPDEPETGAQDTLPKSDSNDLLVSLAQSPESTPPQPPPDLLSSSPPPPQNGEFSASAAEPTPDEKDKLIEQLLNEIEILKKRNDDLMKQVEYLKFKMQEEKDQLRGQLQDLQFELDQTRQQCETLRNDNSALQNAQNLSEQSVEAHESLKKNLELAQAQNKNWEEKFAKLKQIYDNLKQQHVTLIRKEADVEKKLHAEEEEKKTMALELEQQRVQFSAEAERIAQNALQSGPSVSELEDLRSQQVEAIKRESELQEKLKQAEEQCSCLKTDLESTHGVITSLTDKLSSQENTKSDLETECTKRLTDIKKLEEELKHLQDQVKVEEKDKTKVISQLKDDMLSLRLGLLDKAVDRGIFMLRGSLDMKVSVNSNVAAGLVLDYLRVCSEELEKLRICPKDMLSDSDGSGVIGLVQRITCYAHFVSAIIPNVLHAAELFSDDSQREEFTKLASTCVDENVQLLESLRQGKSDESLYSNIQKTLDSLRQHALSLVPNFEDIQRDELGSMVESEMETTVAAVDDAAKRMAELLDKSHDEWSGIELEVNATILDSCHGLMQAIKLLIEKSKALQYEIVAEGRGSFSSLQFYKQHHRWTEGLISAAKAVGLGANYLVETAEKVVTGDGKFEELVVCAGDVAASTTQLVVASKVKARSDSEKLAALRAASKQVVEKTGHVVASARSGATKMDEKDTWKVLLDKISVGQAKRMVMQSQVNVLELESNLQKEREKLSALRRTYYNLAGEGEGFDEETVAELMNKDKQEQESLTAAGQHKVDIFSGGNDQTTESSA